MPSDRDPRLDPRPGATVKKGSRQRYVMGRVCNQIMYRTEDHHYKQTNILKWRKWARDAEVLEVADAG